MTTSLRWTAADLETLPDDGKTYEIIDGELFVSKQPNWHHQRACLKTGMLLEFWSSKAGTGQVNLAPGVIFADDEDVAPDVIWISNERLQTALEGDGRLHCAPELVVEVLSFTGTNERRDREAKLKLYSRREVSEYWILDWRKKEVEVYRRDGEALQLSAILTETETLHTPLLEGFSCLVSELFR